MPERTTTVRRVSRQRSAPGGRKAKSAGDGGCARVRMYRQGLGDCFLLSFPGETQPVHMLIDCGVILGTQNPKPIMQKVVADIKDATGGRLDVLVATHEHWDHLSGFIQAREIFDDMTIDEIWFAWTEDPGNDLAQQLKKERADRLNSLHVALERWQASGLQPRGAFGVASLLGFFGEPLAAANDNNTGAALKYLTTRKDAKIRYFEPGQSLTVKGASGARVYVLGPPQDARLIRKSSPTKTGREVYEETGFSIAVEAGFFAALRLGAAEGPGIDDRLSYPFDPYYHVTPSQAEQHGDLKKYYSSDASWRRIDRDWLAVAGELALALDNDTNNTSLALAIELPSRDVILFPADAQVGNWESWQTLRWQVKDSDGQTRSVTSKDLLERTVLYKVGHHASHNATLRANGLESMQHRGLMALVPVDHDMAMQKRWNFPFAPLLKRLKEKCRGRVMRADTGVPSAATEQGLGLLDAAERKKFEGAVKQTKLYIDVEVPVSEGAH